MKRIFFFFFSFSDEEGGKERATRILLLNEIMYRVLHARGNGRWFLTVKHPNQQENDEGKLRTIGEEKAVGRKRKLREFLRGQRALCCCEKTELLW